MRKPELCSYETFENAVWNAFTTASAVGESGCPPVTPAGRIVASMLMLIGHPLYDQTKNQIGQLLNGLTGNAPTRGFEGDVLTRLDRILERLS